MVTIIQYDRETLLELRHAPASKKKYLNTKSQDVDRKVAMQKAAKIWKPSFGVPQESNNEEEFYFSSDEKITVSVMIHTSEILNKLTESNIDVLSVEFLKLQLNDRYDRVAPLCDVMFNRVVEQEQHPKLYAELLVGICKQPECSKIIADFIKTKVLDRCKNEVQKVKSEFNYLWTSEAEYRVSGEEKLEKKLEVERPRLLQYTLGLVTFIGHLYHSQMVTFKTIISYANSLMGLQDESSYECVCKLLKMTGQKLENDLKQVDLQQRVDSTAQNDNKYYDRRPPFNPEKMFDTLKRLGNKETSAKLPSGVLLEILDLIDLRNNQWKPRKEIINQGQQCKDQFADCAEPMTPTDELDSSVRHEKRVEVGPSTIRSEPPQSPTSNSVRLGQGRGKIPKWITVQDGDPKQSFKNSIVESPKPTETITSLAEKMTPALQKLEKEKIVEFYKEHGWDMKDLKVSAATLIAIFLFAKNGQLDPLVLEKCLTLFPNISTPFLMWKDAEEFVAGKVNNHNDEFLLNSLRKLNMK